MIKLNWLKFYSSNDVSAAGASLSTGLVSAASNTFVSISRCQLLQAIGAQSGYGMKMKEKSKLAKTLLTDDKVCLNCGNSYFDSEPGLSVARLHCKYIHEDVNIYEACIGWTWGKSKN